MAVKVAVIGREIKEVEKEERMTLREVLEKAGISPDELEGYEVRVNGKRVEDLDVEVGEEDRVVVVPRLKAGR